MTTGQLFFNSRDRLQVGAVELTSGSPLEVLVLDRAGVSPVWVHTTVEHNGDTYYLTGAGLKGYSPAGLFARVE